MDTNQAPVAAAHSDVDRIGQIVERVEQALERGRGDLGNDLVAATRDVQVTVAWVKLNADLPVFIR